MDGYPHGASDVDTGAIERSSDLTPTVENKTATDSVGPSTMPTAADGWWEQERLKFLVDTVAAADGIPMHLDVGGGRGTFATILARTGATVICVDGHPWQEWS